MAYSAGRTMVTRIATAVKYGDHGGARRSCFEVGSSARVGMSVLYIGEGPLLG